MTASEAPSTLAASIKQALRCVCPRCREGALYEGRWSLKLRDHCPVCALDYSRNDSADSPAVFLIFILGFLIVPLALFVEMHYAPAIWVHAVLWIPLTLGITLGALRPLKAYVIAIQYKYRPGDWE